MDVSVSEQLVIAPPSHARGIMSVAAPTTHNWPAAITQALQQPNGARFYRCALQVNTPLQGRFKGFDSKHARHSQAYKRDYGLNLAKKCKKAGIDVVGICDHNSVEYLDTLRKELSEEGIFVFPGFEVASTEGIHVLCLFDLWTPAEELDHVLTELGLPPKDRWVTGVGLAPRQSPKSFPQIIEHIQRNRRGICIAAHMDRENGLLFECAKTTRVQYFTDPNLLAGQIAGALSDLTSFNRKVFAGELNHYRREHALALVNCLDVYNLKDLSLPACSTLIKMSAPSIEGLWQAFLDPISRLRRLTEAEGNGAVDERNADAVELVAIAWEGGFLDGCGIRFNENLNCLIGGRGTGKSTIIESLRYVLDQRPISEQAGKAHDGIVREVIQNGTKISLLVHARHPAPAYYRIERSVPGEPVIYDEAGRQSQLKIFDIISSLAIFGQHEIAEIANDSAYQLKLLRHLRAEEAARLEINKQEFFHQLEKNRIDLVRAYRELQEIDEQLGKLPALEEKLRRYQENGLEQRLREQSLLAREEQIILAGRKRIAELKKGFTQVRQRFELNGSTLDSFEVEDLPSTDLWEKLQTVENASTEALREALAQGESVLERTQTEILAIAQTWQSRRQARQGDYEATLRELQKEGIDGHAFVSLRKEMEALEPLRSQQAQRLQKLRDLEKKRKRLLQKWQESKAKLFKLDVEAAKHLSKLLEGRVRISAEREGGREVLYDKIRALKKGLKPDFFERLSAHENFTLAGFIAQVREGKAALCEHYGLTDKQATTLANLEEPVLLEMEELELPTLMCIELNVATPGEAPRWKSMSELSIGQKATAILLMLFPESGTPLIIDQPEDDLDNRFIADQIIPKLREEKQRRQFVFVTHNANLPVLGDAELIVALETNGDGRALTAKVRDSNVGSIDCEPVKLLVEQVLEGGQQAFEMRRAKYGF